MTIHPATIALVGLMAFLIFSAMAKAANPDVVRRAAEQFGVPKRLSRRVIGGFIGIEWALAATLGFSRSWYASVSVGVLFGIFAGLGIQALLSGRRIDCGCFGSMSSGSLGWFQVAQLPVVIGCLVLIEKAAPGQSVQSATATVFVAHALAAASFIATLAPSWRRVRGQRISFAGAASIAVAAKEDR